jgi:hypothetical protein
MPIHPHIDRMEKLLKIEEVSINEVCRAADVDRSVWTRIKQQKGTPRGRTAKKLRKGIAIATEGRVDASWFLRSTHQQAAD